MSDLHNSLDVKTSILPQVATTNAAIVGAIIDHQGSEFAEYVIETGTLASANATFTTVLEEGDAANLSDAAVAPAQSLNGTAALASFTFADGGKVFKLGYHGNKRYTRLTITPAGTAGNAAICAVVVLDATNAPTANPPV